MNEIRKHNRAVRLRDSSMLSCPFSAGGLDSPQARTPTMKKALDT